MSNDPLAKYLNSPQYLFSTDPSKLGLTPGEVPPGWAGNDLTRLLEDAHKNIQAAYYHFGLLFNRYSDILGAFRAVEKELVANDDTLFQIFLLGRAGSAFVTGVRLASSGQVPEAYMVTRRCLELAGYAILMEENPDAKEVWIRRHDDNQSKSEVKKTFQIRAINEIMMSKDNDLAEKVKKLYDFCIDYGGHPNERAVNQSIEKVGDTEYRVNYLSTGDSVAMKCCLTQVARIGITCLEVFSYVFPDVYTKIDMDKKLNDLKKNL